VVPNKCPLLWGFVCWEHSTSSGVHCLPGRKTKHTQRTSIGGKFFKMNRTYKMQTTFGRFQTGSENKQTISHFLQVSLSYQIYLHTSIGWWEKSQELGGEKYHPLSDGNYIKLLLEIFSNNFLSSVMYIMLCNACVFMNFANKYLSFILFNWHMLPD
jgi:hypothetical protein